MSIPSTSLPLEQSRKTSRVHPAGIQPLPFWRALLYLALPALLFRVTLYSGLPALVQLGLRPFEAYMVAFTVPTAILFACAFGFAQRDGYLASWKALKERFRLRAMGRLEWLWTIGGLLVTFLSIGALSPTAAYLAGAIPALAPPDFFPPWLKPGSALQPAQFADYIGSPLRGNWTVVALFAVLLFFNIFGEELWWRGYLLPRQEAAHGRPAWAMHGGLWLAWHLVFYPWQALALLPICLVIPYIAQRFQNTWPAILIHTQNAAILLLVLAQVLGLG